MSIIKFENVSKKYKLYSKGGLFLRDRITHALQQLNPFNHRSQLSASSSQEAASQVAGARVLALGSQHVLERDFWALKDVSFKIKKGESVGFIGRNGAGKSTILKLLARVTKPSSGSIAVNGRVAALIEVGAGFHPELTGRENIYLNGSILGMRKVEIEECFDSIVSFAELQDFIDTPVKHYSSGMYVRLGFAIATHSNPDIFLIDEVLSVGDEAFQQKCQAVFEKLKAAGKTMVLVSHQLDKVEEVCERCVYVHHGHIVHDGLPSEAIKRYRLDVKRNQSGSKQAERLAIHAAEILDVVFYDRHGQKAVEFQTGDDLIVEIRYRAYHKIDNPVFGISVYGLDGAHVTGFNTRTNGKLVEFIDGESSIFCRLPRLCLNEGAYSVSVSLHDFDGVEVYDFHKTRYKLVVGEARKHIFGLVTLPTEWAWNRACTQRLPSLNCRRPPVKLG